MPVRRAKAFSLLGLIASLIAILPVLAAVAGAAIAEAAGCTVTAAGAQSCAIFGYQAKELIYAMSMSYWLLIFTALYCPVAIGLFLAAFITRGKGSDPAAPYPVAGLQFWLIAAGALMLPLITTAGLLLLALALIRHVTLRRRERTSAEPSDPAQG
jgi:hypothetical protein